MEVKEFIELCKEKVTDYTNNLIGQRVTKDDVFVVWQCKTLQNHKAILSTTAKDGMLYEITYNGDKKQMYVDTYRKQDNICYQI